MDRNEAIEEIEAADDPQAYEKAITYALHALREDITPEALEDAIENAKRAIKQLDYSLQDGKPFVNRESVFDVIDRIKTELNELKRVKTELNPNYILDKIRAEILEEHENAYARSDDDTAYGLSIALDILDKYKADNSEIPNYSQKPKTGHWNDIPKYKDIAWYCSECEHFTTVKHNYCPKCGAKMAERGKNEN